MDLSSEQGPPGAGHEEGARFRRVRLTAALRQEEHVHLFACNSPAYAIKLVPKSESTFVTKGSFPCPGQHPGIHRAVICPWEEATGNP